MQYTRNYKKKKKSVMWTTISRFIHFSAFNFNSEKKKKDQFDIHKEEFFFFIRVLNLTFQMESDWIQNSTYTDTSVTTNTNTNIRIEFCNLTWMYFCLLLRIHHLAVFLVLSMVLCDEQIWHKLKGLGMSACMRISKSHYFKVLWILDYQKQSCGCHQYTNSCSLASQLVYQYLYIIFFLSSFFSLDRGYLISIIVE